MSEDVAMSGGTVVLEYIPETDQVRIIYTCLMTQYQRISARNTCLTVLQDFLSLNKYENDGGQVLSKKRYRSFDYFRPDSEKYIREEGLRKAQYTTFFQLSF